MCVTNVDSTPLPPKIHWDWSLKDTCAAKNEVRNFKVLNQQLQEQVLSVPLEESKIKWTDKTL